jgi:hypothetical protein
MARSTDARQVLGRQRETGDVRARNCSAERIGRQWLAGAGVEVLRVGVQRA